MAHLSTTSGASMRYFLLKSKEQVLATPGTFMNSYGSISCDLGPDVYSNSITDLMFSIIVDENGKTLNNDNWHVLPWMIQEEISPETHPEYFI